MRAPINPAVGKSVQAGNIRANYFECGEGAPLILLHGLCDNGLPIAFVDVVDEFIREHP